MCCVPVGSCFVVCSYVFPALVSYTAHVVTSLMRAINKREKEDAIKFLNVLLTLDTDSGSVDMQMNLKKPAPPEVVKEFT